MSMTGSTLIRDCIGTQVRPSTLILTYQVFGSNYLFDPTTMPKSQTLMLFGPQESVNTPKNRPLAFVSTTPTLRTVSSEEDPTCPCTVTDQPYKSSPTLSTPPSTQPLPQRRVLRKGESQVREEWDRPLDLSFLLRVTPSDTRLVSERRVSVNPQREVGSGDTPDRRL